MAAQSVLTTSQAPVHILDLPQLYTRPSSDALISALDVLAFEPPTFGLTRSDSVHREFTAANHEIAAYLTRVVSSPLTWLSDEDAEIIRDLASRRLSERSGRTGMTSFTRTFSISLTAPFQGRNTLEIRLHEPALTGDDLGHKTWSSSYVMAKLLPTLMPTLHSCETSLSAFESLASTGKFDCTCITLELGAGTGLLGISHAALTHRRTILTDLPEIVPNLAYNLALNRAVIDLPSWRTQQQHVEPYVACGTLDWTSPLAIDLHMPLDRTIEKQQFSCNGVHTCKRLNSQLILVADPIYSPDHPRLLVDAVVAHLAPPPTPASTAVVDTTKTSKHVEDKGRSKAAPRVLIAYPVSRTAYLPQITELKTRLRQQGLAIVREGMEEDVQDDWDENVVVEWTIWGWESDATLQQSMSTADESKS